MADDTPAARHAATLARQLDALRVSAKLPSAEEVQHDIQVLPTEAVSGTDVTLLDDDGGGGGKTIVTTHLDRSATLLTTSVTTKAPGGPLNKTTTTTSNGYEAPSALKLPPTAHVARSAPSPAAAAVVVAPTDLPPPPCYLHRRFDDAVDIERVLEELASDAAMSHHRLVQTATGVREVSKQLQRRPIKRAVRNVVIITKARDNHLVVLTRELAEWLLTTPRYGSGAGVNVYVDAKLKTSKRFGADELLDRRPDLEGMLRYWTPELCCSTPEKFDLVLTLGGDGTVLFTSWLFQRIVPPILSFSLGSLGFLTPFDFENYKAELNRIMGGLTAGGATKPPHLISFNTTREVMSSLSRPSNGSSSPVSSVPGDVISDAGMRVNLRMRFTCTVHHMPRRRATSATPGGSQQSTPSLSSSVATTADSSTLSMAGITSPPAQLEPERTTQFEVLNEIVIDRGPSPYVSNLELYGDDALLTVIQADGCIFSTPTGSTAYSLSAGGSLVHPSIPAILLTPICPHTLSFRPMLLNDTISLRVAIPRGSRAGAWCSFDGKGRVELRRGDYVEIRASRYPFAAVVGERGEGWIDSVSRTLRWNTREARQKGWSSAAGRGGGRRRRGAGIDTPASSSSTSLLSSAIARQDAIPEGGSDDDVDGRGDDGEGGAGGEGEEGEDDDGDDAEYDIDFDDDADTPPSGANGNGNGGGLNNSGQYASGGAAAAAAASSKSPPRRRSTQMSELSLG